MNANRLKELLGGVRLSLIAAVATNHVIGAGQAMPWRLSSDLKRFKRLTTGKPLVMGRKTFESIGRPLPDRPNVVISRHPSFSAEGVTVAPTLDAALREAAESAVQLDDKEIIVIGGGQVYRDAIEMADRLYITHVDTAPSGDTYFPVIDPAIWRETAVESTNVGPRDTAATRFVVYERVASSGHG